MFLGTLWVLSPCSGHVNRRREISSSSPRTVWAVWGSCSWARSAGACPSGTWRRRRGTCGTCRSGRRSGLSWSGWCPDCSGWGTRAALARPFPPHPTRRYCCSCHSRCSAYCRDYNFIRWKWCFKKLKVAIEMTIKVRRNWIRLDEKWFNLDEND